MYQVLIPISGRSKFFPDNEYFFPKPLVEVAGQPMVEAVVENLRQNFGNPRFIFVLEKELAHEFSLGETLMLLGGPETKIVLRPDLNRGALCSCLYAINAIEEGQPLVIVNSDQVISEDLEPHLSHFIGEGAWGGVVTFDSVHPRWSYVRSDDDNTVLQTYEKQVISRAAIAGLYFYSTGKTFLNAAESVLLSDDHYHGQFFISSTMNHLILEGGTVMFRQLRDGSYHSFYSPAQISKYEQELRR